MSMSVNQDFVTAKTEQRIRTERDAEILAKIEEMYLSTVGDQNDFVRGRVSAMREIETFLIHSKEKTI